ncbi:unnamed protein product [Linum trigynum]|uniref:Uncharacterized protein n=1 Tax=Linum trigynum TaxID=586398 RepID=A0AAV2E5R9_9ROSI
MAPAPEPQRKLSPERNRNNINLKPLNDTVREKGYRINWADPQWKPENRSDHRKYCEFHREIGHINEHCYNLKVETKALIARGTLQNTCRQVNM